jgi:hypothetical protein
METRVDKKMLKKKNDPNAQAAYELLSFRRVKDLLDLIRTIYEIVEGGGASLTVGEVENLLIASEIRVKVAPCISQIRAYDHTITSNGTLTNSDILVLSDSHSPGGRYCVQVLADQLNAKSGQSDIIKLWRNGQFQEARDALDTLSAALILQTAQLRLYAPSVYDALQSLVTDAMASVGRDFQGSTCLDPPPGFNCSEALGHSTCAGLIPVIIDTPVQAANTHFDFWSSLGLVDQLAAMKFTPERWNNQTARGYVTTILGHYVSLTDEPDWLIYESARYALDPAPVIEATWIDSQFCLRQNTSRPFVCYTGTNITFARTSSEEDGDCISNRVALNMGSELVGLNAISIVCIITLFVFALF